MDTNTTTPQYAWTTNRSFPPFDLERLIRTVFRPKPGEKVAILIDLDDPADIKDFKFLGNPDLTIQRHAYEVFYQGLKNGILDNLGASGGEMFAYQVTGGSNLDLPDEAFDPQGNQLSLEKEIYPEYSLILCVSTNSATAPLTALAKKHDFRGATLHGLNQTILTSGLAVDYNEVSREAERLRLGMTKADWVEIDFAVAGHTHTLHLQLDNQEAQKSHGLCQDEPDVANLPAGEIYYVPTDAHGEFPMKYADGTLGLMSVKNGRIFNASLIEGSQTTIDEHNAKLASDPVTGELGELGFGTQELPVSGRDIQDEKIRGTMHVATGRSDHLGGSLTPDRFSNKMNATHDDILFAPFKTPEIDVPEVRMQRDGTTTVLIAHYEASDYLKGLLSE